VKINKVFAQKFFFPVGSLLTLLFLLFIASIYYRHATTFSFVDEYTNIVVGYFINHGQKLYTNVFFHHQLLIPYISAIYQQLIHPNSLYILMRDHRLMIIIFSLLFDILLIARFRYLGIGFSLFFEPLKYYLFGNLFLAESFVVYPLTYLLGLAYEKLKKKKISVFDLLLSALFTWFVLFMREPYTPLAIGFFAFILITTKNIKKSVFPLILFLVLTGITLLSVSLKDYIFQVFIVNMTYVIPGEINTTGKFFFLLISFFYPLYIFFEHSLDYYRVMLLLLNSIFLICFATLLYKKHHARLLLLIFFSLGIANIRWVSSSIHFYGAYHMIVWFGMFCFSLFILLKELSIIDKKTTKIIIALMSIVFLMMIAYPKSYLWEKLNREESFTTNYGTFYSIGKAINLLSSTTDTVFVHGWFSLIYWQADRASAYPYIMYYPVTNAVPQYAMARINMFNKTPPDFYYTDCKGKTANNLLPNNVKDFYMPMYFSQKPTCLYIKKTKMNQISKEQLLELNKMGYYFVFK
jgi:hypothetical protein